MRGFVVIAVLVSATGIAAAQDSAAPPAKRGPAGHGATRPAPVVIPQQLAPPQESYASMPEPSGAAAALAPSACQARLAKIATFQPLPVLIGPGECGATDAVLLETIILPDQAKVTLTPAATLRCTMAEEISHWVREDIVPAAKELGAPLRGVDNFDSYECRGRNRVRGATLSEHGRANALDVRGFKLADGRTIGLTDVNVDKAWREGVRASVCARFATVLGPGSDGAHEEHIHLDLAERRNNYKLCEWDVREPVKEAKTEEAPPPSEEAAPNDQAALIPAEIVPLPRPRPLAANTAEGLSRTPFRKSRY